MSETGPSRIRRRPWAIAFFLVAVGIVAAGVGYYRQEWEGIRHEEYHDLAAIAELKAGQIEQWRRQHLLLADRMSSSPLFARTVAAWLGNPQATGLREDLEERLRLEMLDSVYVDVLLLDPQGKTLLSVLGETTPLSPAGKEALEVALATGKATLSDLYNCACGQIHLDAVAPVPGPANRPLAAVVHRCNAGNVLYPLIQSWPTPSPSAETLLVERDGDEVLFLNELRHRQGTALSLRQPLSRADRPATQAVLGKQGMFEGQDYRGVEVLADLRPIPGSPWFMVAKRDASEIFAEGRYRAGATALFAGLALLLAAAATAYLFRRRQVSLYRGLYQAQRQRREALEEFRTTLYSIGDAVITADREGRVRQMNREAERLTGWAEAQAAGRNVDEVFHVVNEESRAAVENPVQRVLREGVVVGLANHSLLIARDGTEGPIADSGAPIRDKEGIAGVVLVFRDQTEERAAEKALRDSEERFRTLVEEAPGAIFVETGGRFAYLNQATLHLLGAETAEPLIGQPMEERFPPSSLERVREHLRLLHGERREVPRTEATMLRLDGTPVEVEGSAAPILFGGEPGALVFVSDISERKLAERDLAEEAIRRRILVEGSRDGIVVLDEQGGVFEANRRYGEMLGYTPEEVLRLHVWDWDSQWTHDELLEMLRQVDAAGAHFETRHRRKDGTLLDVEISTNGAVVSGRKLVFCVCRDISARKRAEAEREKLESQLRQAVKMEAVGRLAGGVAHDFNNMLSVILGHVELARSRFDVTEDLQQHLREIASAAERSADLTRQLLAFSRRQTIAPKAIDLNARLNFMERMLQRLIGEDIDLVFSLSPDLWPVLFDPSQVDQLAVNLTVNSREAMPGGGRLTVETRNVTLDEAFCGAHAGTVPGDYVLLAVTDDGCGMDRETLEHAFEPFYTTKTQGTGLGLATVFGIVQQNHGCISLYSEPGRGTSVKIYLPRHRGEAEDLTAGSPRRATAIGGQETVLLAEDNDLVRRLTQVMLERLGYQVLAAANPGQALSLCQDHGGEVHLLLTDVVMPGMTGRELSAKIIASRPRIRVLFMSGYPDEAIAHQGVLEEGIRFLRKPFSLDDLAAKIREALRG